MTHKDQIIAMLDYAGITYDQSGKVGNAIYTNGAAFYFTAADNLKSISGDYEEDDL